MLQNVHCEVNWHSTCGVRVSDGTSNSWSLITEYQNDPLSIGPVPCHRMSDTMITGPIRVWRSSTSKSGPVASEVVFIPSLMRKKLRAPACTFHGACVPVEPNPSNSDAEILVMRVFSTSLNAVSS